MPIGVQGLEHHLTALLKENHLNYESLSTYGTPRRLAIIIKGLAGGSLSKSVERKGPTVMAAFDQEGRPLKAGEGFFRSLHMEIPTLTQIKKGEIPGLEIRTVKEVDYLFASFEQKGVSTRALLATRLPQLILGLEFPKKMRWSDFEIEYPRPLRWIAALFGSEIIPFAVGNILSGNVTYGHRWLSPNPITLHNGQEYVESLRQAWVMADIKERRASIEEQLATLTEQLHGEAAAKERVMPQVLHLVEWPFLTAASFDKKFLQAPKEVLISEMVEHQKYFPVTNNNHELLPYFVVVCNIHPTDLIRAGNQKALSPRLADGMFLYEEDLKVPLDRFNEKLKAMTFQKELGSVWEKVQRLIASVEILHANLPISAMHLAKRAATLCKADLASELVGEFPELQGIVGKLYALKHGENPEVAIAIDEHWMPRGEKSPLPKTPCGILLSLAEKIDNFLSCYILDLKPTSSSDPYALRRQAIGMFKMLIEGKYYLSLRKVFKESLELFLNKTSVHISGDKESVLNEIFTFLTSRFRTILVEYGFEKDEVEAVLARGLDDPYDLYSKAKDLNTFRKNNRSAFLATHEIHTRAKKILFSQYPHLVPGWCTHPCKNHIKNEVRLPSVNSNLFKDESEAALFQKIQATKNSFHVSLIDRREPRGRHWEEAFALLAELQGPVNKLFDRVKVIDDDLEVRTNRLSLLQEVWDLCEELIDFSKIQEHAG